MEAGKGKISPEQYKRLKALQEASGELPDIAAESAPATCTLSTVEGMVYMLGDLELFPATLETLAILDAIDSPFMRVDGSCTDEDLEIRNIAKTVFVFAAGAAAGRAIMAVTQRRRALERYAEMAKTAPEYFAVFLQKSDLLAQIEAEFEAEAVSVYSSGGMFPITDAIHVIREIIGDAMDGFDLLPETGQTEKKTDGLTLNT
jgi:hypothetical protein